jgi:hypothetical protein
MMKSKHKEPDVSEKDKIYFVAGHVAVEKHIFHDEYVKGCEICEAFKKLRREND